MKPSPWSAERESALLDHMRAGLSASQIAEKLGGGISRGAVIGKLRRMGLHLPTMPHKLAAARPRKKRPAAPITAVAPRVPATPVTPVTPVTLLASEPHHCKWPVSEVRGPDTLYCGAHRENEVGPYCRQHRIKAKGFARGEGFVL